MCILGSLREDRGCRIPIRCWWESRNMLHTATISEFLPASSWSSFCVKNLCNGRQKLSICRIDSNPEVDILTDSEKARLHASPTFSTFKSGLARNQSKDGS